MDEDILTRSEKLLKDYVNRYSQQCIELSTAVSDTFLLQKQDIISKQESVALTRSQLEANIRVLRQLQMYAHSHPAEGMSRDVAAMCEQHQAVLAEMQATIEEPINSSQESKQQQSLSSEDAAEVNTQSESGLEFDQSQIFAEQPAGSSPLEIFMRKLWDFWSRRRAIRLGLATVESLGLLSVVSVMVYGLLH